MKTIEVVYENAIEHWRLNKGIGTAIIPEPYDYKPLVLGILQRLYTRSPTIGVLIMVANFDERMELVEYLTHQEIEENNKEFTNLLGNKTLRIYTTDFAEGMPKFAFTYSMIILVHPTTLSTNVLSKLSLVRFKLVVLDRLLRSNTDSAALQCICPTLPDFQQNEMTAVRTSTPVEERMVGVPVSDEQTRAKLESYDNYINESVTIFGSFEVMQKAHKGDASLNISANQMCYNIAQENGWNENLDMNFPFNVQIDAMYNPNSLRERVTITYDIIRNRSNMITDYPGKLEAIANIVKEHIGKKILIISKRAEFASNVCEYLNKVVGQNTCLPYHDKLPPISLTDATGKPILIKTGSRKGEPKIIAHKAQKSLNQKRFNLNEVNVLSTNSSPDKDLAIDVQVVIITSPKCNSIEEYIYRLSNVEFPDNKILLYTIYCEHTQEHTLMLKHTESDTHLIVNKSENFDVFVENSGVVIDI